MIRVAHVTMSLGAGGVERLLLDAVPLFDRARFDVRVLLLREPGFRAEELERRGVPVRALGGRGLWDVSLLPKFRRAVLDARCDILHAHLVWPSALSALFKGRARLVWHVHDAPASLSLFHSLAERTLIGRSDAVVAVSESIAAFLRARYPALAGRVRVFPNAIVAGEPVPRRAGEPPTIGFLGRLDEPKKGLAVLLRAARRVVDRRPDVRFLIAGNGPAREGLGKLSADLGLSGAVEWLGEVRDSAEALARFDVLALPSLWEGLPVVLLEAMAAGLPAVAGRVGGIPEVLVDGETGRLVAPGDDGALAEALLSVISSPDRGRAMGLAGRKRVLEKYDMVVYVRRLEALYEELLGGKGGRSS